MKEMIFNIVIIFSGLALVVLGIALADSSIVVLIDEPGNYRPAIIFGVGLLAIFGGWRCLR